jgi:gamma-glutamyltranspeptidase
VPSPYNYIHPKKRPLSSSVPIIIEDHGGNVEIVSGASGGSRIITATLQTIINMMDFEMDIGQATKDPRFHHQLIPNEIQVEYEFDETLSFELEQKGHKVIFIQLS